MCKNAKRQVIACRLSKKETVSLNQYLQIIEYQPHVETGRFLSTAEAYFNRVNPDNRKRQANSSEVKELCTENNQLKELVAELALKNKVLKKSLLG